MPAVQSYPYKQQNRPILQYLVLVNYDLHPASVFSYQDTEKLIFVSIHFFEISF